MSKKKKKKKDKKKKGIFHEVDKSLSSSYESILDEIEEMQMRLDKADRKAKKKQEKMNKGVQFYTNEKAIRARKKMVDDWDKTDFLGRLETTLKQISPIISIIARLVVALILAFLSIDAIKETISPKTLRTLDKIYSMSMSM
jgi:hypothetical protein